LLWAFMNSISKPEEVKSRYVLVTAASKFGGFLSAGWAWLYMSQSRGLFSNGIVTDAQAHVTVLMVASLSILTLPFLLWYLTWKVPAAHLMGYEYRREQDIDNKNVEDSICHNEDGSGFTLLFKNAYVAGIFAMIFFWEAVNVIFNYMRLSVGFDAAESMSSFSAFLYKNAMFTHIVGVLIAIFGTSSIIQLLGERLSLMLVPALTGLAIIFCLLVPSTTTVIVTYIFIRAINYSFASPLREGLYIPTSASIKFKAKSWIDSFGSKSSKAFGSLYNKGLQWIPIALLPGYQMGFFVAILVLWTLLAYVMGKRWSKAVKSGEVIGQSPQT